MVRVFWLARMWVCAVLGWIGFTYGIPHPLTPHTRTRFISRRMSSLGGTGANSTNEVFVEQLGIIKEPTHLKVLTADIRSKRSEGVNLMTIEDPEWKKQWYLYRDPEPSLNVAGAWQLASGKGVVVGIVSDGVQRHKDLNIDDRLSFDFHKDVPQSVESRGTQAAGVVAATKNHLCGVGVAYNARIADIRLLEEYSNPRVQAEVFKDKLEQVDVQLHTWSQPRAVTGPLAMAGRVQNALHTGAMQGRGGKGYIYVWDTGNSNAENSCAYDPFVNNIYTIPISGITKSQHRLRSGTACAAILASAYSQNNNSNDHIVTTIGGSQTSCTDQFGESSAAAAMATGVIALALEVNSNLTWRDIQHLLVYTSNALLLKQRNPHDFIFNGASLMVSNAFGFGLIDAAKLVGMATVWKRVEPAVSCQASATAGVTHIGSGISLHTSIIQVSPMTCRVNYLEHVEVSFNLTYTNGRGSIQLSLESPSGTKNVIVPGRPGDDRQKSFNWTVLSVQYWGENPSGGWKLRLQEAKSSKFSAGTAVLYGWSLKFSGLVNVLQIPEQYPKLSPHLATENTEEVVDTNVISSPMDHPRSDNGVIPWWIWLVVGLACLMVLLGVAYLLRQRFFKHRFRQGDDEKTEEETQSLHQEKQQTTTA